MMGNKIPQNQRELHRALDDLGFSFSHQGGRHEIWKHHGGASLPVPRGKLRSDEYKKIVRQAKKAAESTPITDTPNPKPAPTRLLGYKLSAELAEELGLRQDGILSAARNNETLHGFRFERIAIAEAERKAADYPNRTQYLFKAIEVTKPDPAESKAKHAPKRGKYPAPQGEEGWSEWMTGADACEATGNKSGNLSNAANGYTATANGYEIQHLPLNPVLRAKYNVKGSARYLYRYRLAAEPKTEAQKPKHTDLNEAMAAWEAAEEEAAALRTQVHVLTERNAELERDSQNHLEGWRKLEDRTRDLHAVVDLYEKLRRKLGLKSPEDFVVWCKERAEAPAPAPAPVSSNNDPVRLAALQLVLAVVEQNADENTTKLARALLGLDQGE